MPNGRLLALCCATGLLSLTARAETEKERLDKGEVIITTEALPGSDVPRVTVRALVKAPGEKIWPIINDCGRYRDTMVRIKESKELSREGDKVRCQVTMHSPGPIKNLTAVTQAQHTVTDGRWVRAWTLESGDYKLNTGSWTLVRDEADPKRTIVQYQVHTQPNIWVPDWLQEYAMKKGLPNLIEKLRSQTE